MSKTKKVIGTAAGILAVILAVVLFIGAQNNKMKENLRKSYTYLPTEYVTEASMDETGKVTVQVNTPYPLHASHCNIYTMETGAGEERVAVVDIKISLYAMKYEESAPVQETLELQTEPTVTRIYYYANSDYLEGAANMNLASTAWPGASGTFAEADIPAEAVLLWPAS